MKQVASSWSIFIQLTSLNIKRVGCFTSEFSLKDAFRELFNSFIIRALIGNNLLITTELGVAEYDKTLSCVNTDSFHTS